MIRELAYEDFEAAAIVLWKSFYQAEKNNHTMAGMERFRDLVSPVSLSMNTYDGNIELFGYFQDDDLVGVGALKEKKHILLLYVLKEKQGLGFGKELLLYMERKCTGDRISLNSSDAAVSFYEKFGFIKTGERRIEKDLIFTPMEKNRKFSKNY